LCRCFSDNLDFSIGACIAQELALAFPEKVDRLILVAGDCGGAEAVRTDPGIFARLIDKSGTIDDVVNRMFPLLFPPAWLATHDPFRYCPDVYETTSTENAARQLAAFSTWPGSFSRLEAFRSRTLVIAGDADAVVPPENSRRISSRIPGAELVTFHGGVTG
jgi:pimeloyl-ACP methyl ester carboxylesterase